MSYDPAAFTKAQIINASTSVYCTGASGGCTGQEGVQAPSVAAGFAGAVRVSLERHLSEDEQAGFAANATPTITASAIAAELGVPTDQIYVDHTRAEASVEIVTTELGDSSDAQAATNDRSSPSVRDGECVMAAQ